MNALLINFVVRPVMRRVGTAAATALVAQGINGDTVTQVMSGIGAAGLIGADLVSSWWDKRKAVK
jgi:tetrahydromethanopterin S-methyltransferase subunit D